jgi:stage III sporulation protein AE
MKKANKYLQFVIILLVLLSVLSVGALAESNAEDQIINEYKEILPDGQDKFSENDVISYLGFDSMLSEIKSALSGQRGRVLSFFCILIGISVLMALAGVVNGDLAPIVRSTVSALSALVIFSRILPLCREISDSLNTVTGFFSSFVPIICSAVAMGGGSATSSSALLGMGLTLEISSHFTERFLIMLVFAMFLSGIVSAYGGGLRTVARGIRTAFTKGLALLSTVLVGMISLQTVISSGVDNMAMRTARYATTSIIPIVGGTVSGALSTLVGGVAYAKGVIGGSAVAVILSMALSPLVLLLMYKLAFFIAISFLEFCSMDEGVLCLSGMRDALDALISVYVMTMVVYILEIVVILMIEVNF